MNLDEETRKVFNAAIASYNRDRYKNNPKYREYMLQKAKARYAKKKADKKSIEEVEAKK